MARRRGKSGRWLKKRGRRKLRRHSPRRSAVARKRRRDRHGRFLSSRKGR